MASPLLRALGSIAAAALALVAVSRGPARADAPPPATPAISSLAAGVTVYGASWCGACKSLEAKLTQRNIPFEAIDVDRDRAAFDRARAESGKGSSIPLTNISRDTVTWVVGDDANAVERAYKGE
jgi:glutaredoxin